MQVGKGDKAGVIGHDFGQFPGVEPEPILRAPEPLDIGTQKPRRGEHRLICRLLEYDFIPRLDKSGHPQEIRHGRAVGGNDAFGADAIFVGNCLAKRLVARMTGAIEIEVSQRQRQAVEPEVRDFARGQGVADVLLGLGPVHIFGPHRAASEAHALAGRFLRCQ